MANPTTASGDRHADPIRTLIAILRAAAGQDGTIETAQELLDAIEDLTVEGIAALAPKAVRGDAGGSRPPIPSPA